ncbi:MAG: AAA family ATPase [Chloroflexi bacterium]|nr:AAA family ATPase [Chloroflexota bacterium]
MENIVPSYQQSTTDDLELLLATLPPHIRQPLDGIDDTEHLLEIVMDLGREPEARFPGREVLLSRDEVTHEDIEYVVSRIGAFGDDNRAGIPRTLHRISAIRNRMGRIVGLTCRVGRSVLGTMDIIRDLVESGRSILILGKPGVGKTTLLREVARVLADELNKRVIIVDTSNEIAGDGDIPHPGIGRARRMQVPTPTQQHAVMIEAVENHMPEVIVIDEIGTELEAEAARTIAERGVQLVGTAHGNTLANIMMNPTLADLIGGIQPVTLGDEEARRRGTQKTVLERKAPPTFDVLVEMQERQRVTVHRDVSETVDAVLRGLPAGVEMRWRRDDGTIEQRLEVPGRFAPGEERGRRVGGPSRMGEITDWRERAGRRGGRGGWGERAERGERTDRVAQIERLELAGVAGSRPTERTEGFGGYERSWATEEARAATGRHERGQEARGAPAQPSSDRDEGEALELAPPSDRFRRTASGALRPVKVYPYGVNRDRLEAAIEALRVPVTITKDVLEADVVMTLKNYYRKNLGPVRDAEESGKPVFILRSNTVSQIQQSLEALYGMQTAEPQRDIEHLVLQETEDAIQHVLSTSQPVELPPQNAYMRRLQHQLAQQYNVGSRSAGREPHRRVLLFRQD